MDSMKGALIKAGLLDADRAQRIETIEKENKRKADKLRKKQQEAAGREAHAKMSKRVA